MSEETDQALIITRGEKAEFDIFLEKASGFPRPIDLTNFDEFKVCLETETGVLEITQTLTDGNQVVKVSPDVLGQLKVTIDPQSTAILNKGFGQDIDIEWDNGTTPNKKRKRLHKALNVEDHLCASA